MKTLRLAWICIGAGAIGGLPAGVAFASLALLGNLLMAADSQAILHSSLPVIALVAITGTYVGAGIGAVFGSPVLFALQRLKVRSKIAFIGVGAAIGSIVTYLAAGTTNPAYPLIGTAVGAICGLTIDPALKQ